MAGSEESLKVVLSNRIALAKPVRDRSQNAIGRAINWMGMEKSKGSVEIGGIELIEILKRLDESVEIEVSEGSTYLIPFTEAEKVLSRLRQL